MSFTIIIKQDEDNVYQQQFDELDMRDIIRYVNNLEFPPRPKPSGLGRGFGSLIVPPHIVHVEAVKPKRKYTRRKPKQTEEERYKTR